MSGGRRDELQRKAKIALGFAVVLLLFLGETLVAHRMLPNPASPLVWSLLGAGSLVCLGLAAYFWRASKKP